MCFGNVIQGYDNSFVSCFASDCSQNAQNIWYGSLVDAKALCEQCDGCIALHDWNGDGNNWRACSAVTRGGDKKANVILYEACSGNEMFPNVVSCRASIHEIIYELTKS